MNKPKLLIVDDASLRQAPHKAEREAVVEALIKPTVAAGIPTFP